MQNHPDSLFDFETLELYKKSLDYIDFIYDLITYLPQNEKYELTSQIKRAAHSITLNITEGYGESVPLALKYLKTVRGSIRECLVCSTIAFRRKYIDESLYFESRRLFTELSKLATGYRNYLRKKLNK